MRVAIDGASGVGKTTVGLAVADELGVAFFDSGVYYRSVTAFALRVQARQADEGGGFADEGYLWFPSLVEVRPTSGGLNGTVLVDGIDVTAELFSPRIESMVARLSTCPDLRAFVRRYQAAAAENDVVMVGRDIGTSVLPNADHKFYLVAQEEVRIARRYQQLRTMNEKVSLEEVADMLGGKDRYIAAARTINSLPSPDAIVVATDNRSPDEIVREIMAVI